MKRNMAVAALSALAVAALALTGCSATGPAADVGSGDVVTDGTFALALAGDPGNLDPQSSVNSGLGQMNRFLYDSLVNVLDGEIVSGLAKEWVEKENIIEFTLQPDITCADGSALTASDIATNINHVGDPANLSPMAGYAIPVGATAVADDAAGTVTLSTPTVTGFLLHTLALLPMVCGSGLDDREALGTTPAGTGPYTLTAAVPGSSYTLERRSDYTWGPGGVGTLVAGMPKTVTVTVSANATTTANQLLSRELNAGTVFGPDAERLESAGLASSPLTAVIGELIYNQNPGRATADPAIRMALTQALDMTALRDVAGSGKAEASQSFTGQNLCKSDLTDFVPKHDVKAAESALADADLPTLRVVYLDLGAASAAAAELVVSELGDVGVKAQASPVTFTDFSTVLFQNADFDIAMFALDGTTPPSVQAFFSGPTNPNGGQNFAAIDNEKYNTLAAQAAAMPGTSGCDIWNEADAALVSAADAIPFASDDYPVWGANATFSTFFGTVLPATIRMHG